MSLKGNLSTIVADNLDALCYMADMETYDLLYLNKLCRDAFNLHEESDYLGKKCYKILQGKDKPCEFCTNALLKVGEAYKWEHYNAGVGSFYSLADYIVDVAGRKTRLEFAMDVTSHHNLINQLEANLDTQKSINNCIQTLSENLKIDEAINNMLENICEYYAAERSYIFEFDYTNNIIKNTYEWCKDPEKSEIENLQSIDMVHVERWVEKFNTTGEFYISMLHEEVDVNSTEFKILDAQGIKSLMATPFRQENGKIMGFIGVDDPTKNLNNTTLLNSVSLFIYNDLTKRRLYERLEQMNYTDTLTGCYNRTKYMQVMRDYNIEPPNKIGVVFTDINGLRPINETYGQLHGDHFILKNALLLMEIFGEQVFRLGSDEFVILCDNVTQEHFTAMLKNFELKMSLEPGEYNMSFGSVYKEGNVNITKLITNADELMSVEKQRYYKAKFDDGIIYKAGVVETLLNELKNGQFQVYLQPKFEIDTFKINGAEALIRKKDAEGKIISPIDFVPMYENEKVVRHIDFFVLETVCKTLRKWLDEELLIKISVNLSRMTFMEKNIIDDIKNVCNKFNVPVDLIDLEITETSNKIDNLNLTNKIIEAEKAGISISLDDFGAEYSNLLMLTSLNFSQIKLDKSLIDNICTDDKSRTVVKYAIKMCKDMKMEDVLAEGVETEQQREELRQIGCKSGQGYLFSRPIPIDDFYDMYKKDRAKSN